MTLEDKKSWVQYSCNGEAPAASEGHSLTNITGTSKCYYVGDSYCFVLATGLFSLLGNLLKR